MGEATKRALSYLPVRLPGGLERAQAAWGQHKAPWLAAEALSSLLLSTLLETMEPRASTPDNDWELVEKEQPAEQQEAEPKQAEAAPAAPESPQRKPRVSYRMPQNGAECRKQV